jgi:hypothetical protein
MAKEVLPEPETHDHDRPPQRHVDVNVPEGCCAAHRAR